MREKLSGTAAVDGCLANGEADRFGRHERGLAITFGWTALNEPKLKGKAIGVVGAH